MPLHIIVCVKQVLDPEMPRSAFRVDTEGRRLFPPAGIPSVVNGFDENALEAALRIKEVQEARVTVLSMGTRFSLEVIKKALAMGADGLVLLQDELFENTMDSYITAYVLAAAVQKLGKYDLILCGRQASDWDNAQVPLGIAELLRLSCITLARKVEVANGKVVVERFLMDSIEIVQASLPAVVTVTSELGQPRHPTVRSIMAAARTAPTVWRAEDLGMNPSQLLARVSLLSLFIPPQKRRCEMVEGKDEAEAGRNLALKLREAKLL